jgi:hypothetical protein
MIIEFSDSSISFQLENMVNRQRNIKNEVRDAIEDAQNLRSDFFLYDFTRIAKQENVDAIADVLEEYSADELARLLIRLVSEFNRELQ